MTQCSSTLPFPDQPGAGDRQVRAAALGPAAGLPSYCFAQHPKPFDGLLFQPAIGQFLDTVGQPALQEAPVVGWRLRVEQVRAIWPSGPARARPSGRPIGPEPYQSWANLGRAGWRITALVGREVKRTFSDFARLSTGLPGHQTHEAGGQDFGDFGNSIVSWALDHAAKGQRSGPPVQMFHVKSCITVLHRSRS